MRIIRIPIGSTLDDKTKFISEFLRVFPSNSKEDVENIWKRQVAAGVLQMMVDIDTGIVSHVMRVAENGTTYWELSSRFLGKIPIIYDYKPEENTLPDTGGVQASTFTGNSKVEYDIDDILDIISDKGYETLSDDQKNFLSRYSRK